MKERRDKAALKKRTALGYDGQTMATSTRNDGNYGQA